MMSDTNGEAWVLQALKQAADQTCTISFETWRQLRARGYVESQIENTPDGVYVTLSERGRAVLAQGREEAGWYYSSVAQWMPEYSTEKINGFDGPFPTWQDALEALFAEIEKDMNELRASSQKNRSSSSDLNSL